MRKEVTVENKVLEAFKSWMENPNIDEGTKAELFAIKNDFKDIEDRFYKDLEFGTAGLRGVIGAGSNRMNIYTVRKATQGLANYILSSGKGVQSRGVVIAYDNRRMSREFSEEAALVLAANGIKTYLFKALRSTPELSYAIRALNCISGIVVTASHNPPEYNGYKVYWEDGAQIATKRAKGIIEAIDGIEDFSSIAVLDKETAMAKNLFNYLDQDIDDQYIHEVKKQGLGDGHIDEDFKIVYTPLHGTGNRPVRRILKEVGFKNVFVVPEQELPDSEFSTVAYPNPEDVKAFEMAIKLAKEKGAQVVIGTDPDCDRVGVVVKDQNDMYQALTGNQTGALLVDFILSQLKKKGQLKENHTMVKSIVTSEMGRKIANSYGVEMINVLTGFKYIGEKIKAFELNKDKAFLFGYEESYGYLAGTHARDKDAVVASMLICQMAAYYHAQNMSLYEALMALYEKHGYFIENLEAITLAGKEGLNKIAEIMTYFRENQLDHILDQKVASIEDYQSKEKIFLSPKKPSETMDLPEANVLKLILENGSWICLRPSGTEPKLKIYVGVNEDSLKASQESLENLLTFMKKQVDEI